MKKIFVIAFVALASIVMLANCRGFRTYAADGKGGLYRIGVKWFIIPLDINYVEHCKPDSAGKLKCRAVDIKLP